MVYAPSVWCGTLFDRWDALWRGPGARWGGLLPVLAGGGRGGWGVWSLWAMSRDLSPTCVTMSASSDRQGRNA